jgi:hypothetical protein
MDVITMKPSKKDIMTWINALRSGKYKQTTYKLQTEEGYCCLGVACELFIPKNKQQRAQGLLMGLRPIDQGSCPTWLSNIDPIPGRPVDLRISLAQLNDYGCINEQEQFSDNPLSFEEIADILQAVYIEEVLWT